MEESQASQPTMESAARCRNLSVAARSSFRTGRARSLKRSQTWASPRAIALLRQVRRVIYVALLRELPTPPSTSSAATPDCRTLSMALLTVAPAVSAPMPARTSALVSILATWSQLSASPVSDKRAIARLLSLTGRTMRNTKALKFLFGDRERILHIIRGMASARKTRARWRSWIYVSHCLARMIGRDARRRPVAAPARRVRWLGQPRTGASRRPPRRGEPSSEGANRWPPTPPHRRSAAPPGSERQGAGATSAAGHRDDGDTGHHPPLAPFA